MRRPLAIASLLALLAPSGAQARSVAVSLLEMQGLSEPQSRRVLKAAEAALNELSGLEVKPAPLLRRGSPRRSCAEELPAVSATVPPCLAALAVATGTDHALLLSLKAAGGRIFAEGFLIEEGQVRHRKMSEQTGEPEAVVRLLVEALLPGWARKGWGALLLEVPEGAQLKVDGRRTPVTDGQPLALTAQVHSMDLLFDDGRAVLQRLQVSEGERVHVELALAGALAAGVSGKERAEGPLRAVSLGLWGAGAAAIAGSFLAGAASRGAAAELGTCQGTSRSCLSYDAAALRREQAQAYAGTGNLLLGTGAGLLAVGVGLFAFDELWPRQAP